MSGSFGLDCRATTFMTYQPTASFSTAKQENKEISELNPQDLWTQRWLQQHRVKTRGGRLSEWMWWWNKIFFSHVRYMNIQASAAAAFPQRARENSFALTDREVWHPGHWWAEHYTTLHYTHSYPHSHTHNQCFSLCSPSSRGAKGLRRFTQVLYLTVIPSHLFST